jgi:DNA invertase Pin-like site-specific DNA recombinase
VQKRVRLIGKSVAPVRQFESQARHPHPRQAHRRGPLAKLERAMIQERIKAGIARVQAGGKTKSGNPLGRPRIADTVEARIP